MINLEKSKKTAHDLKEVLIDAFLMSFAVVLVSGPIYALFEGKNVIEGIWWAFTTTYTVGYNTVQPITTGGRFITSILLTFSVFILVPLITSRLVIKIQENPKKTPKKKTNKKPKTQTKGKTKPKGKK